MGAACPVRRSLGFKLLQSVSLRHTIQQCLRQDRCQSVSNYKYIHFIGYTTWRCISLHYCDLRYSYVKLFWKAAIRRVLTKISEPFVFSFFSVDEPFTTNMSVVIGVQPKAETTKGSFVVYAERVTEDTGRSTVKNYSSS